MKKKNTNRNSWSSTEVEILKKAVKSSTNTNQGMKLAASQLGRSAGACLQKYYKVCDTIASKVSHKANNLTLTSDTNRFTFEIKSYSVVDGKLILEI